MSETNQQGKNGFFAKLSNFWYYHKTAVIIGTVLAVGIVYLCIAGSDRTKADTYGVVVTAVPLAEEEKQMICTTLGRAVGDLNGDGTEWVTCNFLAFTELAGGAVDKDAYIVFQSALQSDRYELYLLSGKVLEEKGYADYFSDVLCRDAGKEGPYLPLPEEVFTMHTGERLYLAARKMGTSTKSEEDFYRNARKAASALLK